MKTQIDNKKTYHISKKEFLFICVFGFIIFFNYFIFNQIDIILRNQVEFGVLLSEVIGMFLLFSTICLFLIVAILSALCYFSKKGFIYTIAILIGVLLAGYIQVLFFNDTNIMNVNGHVNASAWVYILNALVYITIVAASVIILRKLIKKGIIQINYGTKNKDLKSGDNSSVENGGKDNSENNSNIVKTKKQSNAKKLVIAILFVVFGMQFTGVLSVIPTVEKPAANNELYYFSIDEQLKLSKNDNIVVFVLDRHDTSYADNIFENTPEYKDIFSGFTYYTDSIAQYKGTFPSVVSMLSGLSFDYQRTQKDFMESAWDEPLLFNALHENNYKVNGLLNSTATIYDFNEVIGKFDNIKKLDPDNRKIKHFTFFGEMLKSSLHRLSPYIFKSMYSGYIEKINSCVEISNTPDYYNRTISPESDLAFYKRLTDVKLSADEEKNAFSFVHLLASHNPFNYDEKLTLKQTETSVMAQTRGSYKILEEYFDQMKQLGIYENSTIIVMADHGHWDTLKNLKKITKVPMAALFIKESGQGSDDKSVVVDLKTDIVSQMSHSNFLPTIIEVLYNNNSTPKNLQSLEAAKEISNSYFDVIKPISKGGLGGVQERIYFDVRWTNMNSTSYKGKYKITGEAINISNWERLD